MRIAGLTNFGAACRPLREERRSQRMKTGLRGAFFPLLLATVTVSGCTTTAGGKGAGGGIISTGPQGAGVYITALQGGLVSRNASAQLSKADMQRALEAEYRALEAAPGGQPVVWQGSGVAGSVVAAAPYQVGSQNCRQYSHTLTVEGRDATTRGAACRNADGAWTPLS
jgi:surface antigen